MFEPVSRMVAAGSWLNESVKTERTTAMSSATVPRWGSHLDRARAALAAVSNSVQAPTRGKLV